ncbi:NTP transferase domain-containing protein [Shewanella eurypsychrophilus]|uniref:NTP transferase domain-containing protein n=1 Tax=Shewanella eurypsychrophilus TaxID=2593656 RepID=A0ABX6V5V9_9GAMM|nr:MULTISPECIES: NTP transferase domain-containing protein [Shewanella]QFU22736.1 NTP transferase domain-containing protein [Shewanella sp. YLB-09]QPG58025.1 NTP transferase domain-containing protein [Shewanella eurypsychrophilus]
MPTSEMNAAKQIDCVMPAAGLSSRMGEWKMMLAYQNQTILDKSIENALKFCSRVILVAGYRSDELIERYKQHSGVTVTVNEGYRLGMLSSIKVGIAQVQSEHFFIAHGDMPCLTAELYRYCWQQRGLYSLFPGCEKQTGHPVLIPKIMIPSILHSEQTGNLRRILTKANVRYLNLTDEALFFDVDTPEAYQQLLANAQ